MSKDNICYEYAILIVLRLMEGFITIYALRGSHSFLFCLVIKEARLIIIQALSLFLHLAAMELKTFKIILL